jgi:hypothetical protein
VAGMLRAADRDGEDDNQESGKYLHERQRAGAMHPPMIAELKLALQVIG